MENSTTAAVSAPSSKLATFLSGTRTGAFNGALMLGIYSLVAMVPVFGIAGLTIGPILATVLTTSLFSGFIAVKRSLAHVSDAAMVPVAAGQSHTVSSPATGHAIAPQMDVAESGEPERSTNWAERTGRSAGSQSRVQEILDNGSLSDKDRASEILAARENAAGKNASI